MQRKDAPTTRRAYVDHLRAGVASWPLFLVLVCSGRALVAGDLPQPPPGGGVTGEREPAGIARGHNVGRSGRAEREGHGASLSGLDWAIAGNAWCSDCCTAIWHAGRR